MDRPTFERDLLALIRRYAEFVHLLPATPDNYFNATALQNLDKFAYLGGFSGSCGGRGGFDPKTSCGGAFADAAAFNKKVKVLFLGIGQVEGQGTKNFSDALTQAGIHNVYFESPLTAHEWLTWRRCLLDFAPRLFR